MVDLIVVALKQRPFFLLLRYYFKFLIQKIGRGSNYVIIIVSRSRACIFVAQMQNIYFSI
jgi:hypothetical protein